MEGLIFVLIFLGLIVGVPLIIFQRDRANKAWASAAEGLGLTCKTPSLFGARMISGSIDGFNVKIDTFSRSTGKSSTTYTRFRVRYPKKLEFGLRLTREGFFSGFAKRLGSQDIEVGDATFDPDVMVKANDPLAVRSFLTPARRMRVHRFLTTYRGAVIDDFGIEWHTQGVFREADRIAKTVKALTSLAWHLTASRGTDERLHRVLEARNIGRPDRALEILAAPLDSLVRPPRPEPKLEEAPEPVVAEPPVELLPEEPITPEILDASASQGAPEEAPEEAMEEAMEEAPEEAMEEAMEEAPEEAMEDVPEESAEFTDLPPLLEENERPTEERVLEGELLVLTGREDDARKAFEAARDQAPDDPEVLEWLEQPPPPPVEPEPAAAEARVSDAPAVDVPASDVPASDATARDATAPESLVVEEVCAALFGDDASSYQVTQRFDQRYRDREVRWSGVLLEVESYSFDAVFGSDSGTRAVVILFDTGSGVFGESKVFAVVQLPPEAVGTLIERRGHDVSFRGRLAKVDSVMRNIYVAAAELVGGE